MKKLTMKHFIPVGFVVGIANGMFGAGGGTVLVPALNKLFQVKTHKAHATALAVMLPLSVVSALIYVTGSTLDWPTVGLITIGGVIGGLTGASVMNKLSARWLHTLFGIGMIAAAIRMIWG